MENIKKSSKAHWDSVMTGFDKSIIDSYKKQFEKTEFARVLSRFVTDGDGQKRFFEVGAAPGLFAVVFAHRFHYIPGGIEYSQAGYDSLQKICKEYSFDPSGFVFADFLEYASPDQYDVVMSGWFIEHFADYEDIIRRHIDLLLPWWTLVLSVPNNQIYFRLFQEKLYPGLLLKQHNLKIMAEAEFVRVFQDLSDRGILKIDFLGAVDTARIGQLVSPRPWLQKCLYALDALVYHLGLYKLSREKATLLVVAKKI